MKTIRIILSGAAIAAAGLFIAPQTAVAGSNLCDANRVCIYDHANWVALLGQRSAGGGLVNVSSSANDLTSSWENKTGTGARWYEHANGGGFCRSMPSFSEDNYVGDNSNDKLSSWATNRVC